MRPGNNLSSTARTRPRRECPAVAKVAGALALAAVLCGGALAESGTGALEPTSRPSADNQRAAPTESNDKRNKAKSKAKSRTSDTRLDAKSARAMKLASACLSAGRHQLGRVAELDRTPAKLHALDRAIASLRRGLRAASTPAMIHLPSVRDAIADDLVRALDDQAEIYYARSSFPQARKRVDEALSVIPGDERSVALASRIVDAMAVGSYVPYRCAGSLHDRSSTRRRVPVETDGTRGATDAGRTRSVRQVQR